MVPQEVADARERQLELKKQARIGLSMLTRARLIAREVKSEFTPSLRLETQREIGSLTRLGSFLARHHVVRRCYLFAWWWIDRFVDLRRRWWWLLAGGQLIVWIVKHAAAIERVATATTIFCGVVASIVLAFLLIFFRLHTTRVVPAREPAGPSP